MTNQNGTGQYSKNDATLSAMQSNLDSLYMLANRISNEDTLAILRGRIAKLNEAISEHVRKQNYWLAF